MCTLIVFKDVCEGHPLVIASNRQEVATRPTEGPADRGSGIFAPRDLVLGGSWIGVNDRGLVVALTNRSRRPHRKGCRSRGLLVNDALAAGSLDEAVSTIAFERSSMDHNGFHLLIADGQDAFRIWSEGDGFNVDQLDAGTHIMTGEGCEPEHSLRDKLLRERIGTEPKPEDDAWLDSLLTLHGPEPEDGTCVHGPRPFKLESIFSMTVRMPAERDRIRLRWRDGRPCLGGVWQERNIDIKEST